MGKRTNFGAVVALLSILLALRQTLLAPKNADAGMPVPVQGRNNTALFILGDHHGFFNVHSATMYSLLKRYPDLELHVASHPSKQASVERTAKFAGAKREPKFWPINSQTYMGAGMALGADITSVRNPPGLAGAASLMHIVDIWMAPWPAEELYDMHLQTRHVIDRVDPAVVVLDPMFWVGIDAAREANRPHAFISPNTVSDVFGARQPRLGMFWKYPVMSSGFDFPIPLRRIPENIWLMLKFAKAIGFSPRLGGMRTALREKGLSNPLDVNAGAYREDTPYITQEMDGAALPVDVIPANVTRVGPIVVSVAPVEEQDPELAAWLRRGPTVLVNLGSALHFTEELASAMASALALLLEHRPELQVIWKLRKWGDWSDDYFRKPLERHIAAGHVRVEKWLNADPTALLESGHVVASVHHGGANVYFEAINSGVPHVVLPMWMDCYNFAAFVEQNGLGVWASRKTAPNWTVEELSAGLIKVAGGGPESAAIAAKARKLGDKAKAKGEGRDLAADVIAKLAGSGRK